MGIYTEESLHSLNSRTLHPLWCALMLRLISIHCRPSLAHSSTVHRLCYHRPSPQAYKLSAKKPSQSTPQYPRVRSGCCVFRVIFPIRREKQTSVF